MTRNVEVNPSVVLREEFDDWAVLFDPDTGIGYGLNPVGVFIWKHLDGHHTAEDIIIKMREDFDQIPEEVGEHLQELIKSLIDRGLAGYVVQ